MVLVDSDVLLDVLGQDPIWAAWSAGVLRDLADRHELAINPMIFAELSAHFTDPAELERAVPAGEFVRMNLPYDAAFLAGHAFRAYRRNGGTRTAPLPGFFIGAHAAVLRCPLVTRDVRPYRRYFPTVELITPS